MHFASGFVKWRWRWAIKAMFHAKSLDRVYLFNDIIYRGGTRKINPSRDDDITGQEEEEAAAAAEGSG
jgi:hypothetical protein